MAATTQLSITVDAIANVVLPLACIHCHVLLHPPDDSPLRSYCRNCRKLITLDGQPSTLYEQGIAVEVCAAAVDDGPLAQSLRALKFHGAALPARALGRVLGTLPSIGEADIWTFVPSSRARQRGRALEVAASLTAWAWFERQRSGMPISPGLGPPRACLRRIRETPPQRGLSLEERRLNTREVFGLHPAAAVDDARVVLFDDVITTGATLASAARVLLESGARSVRCATLLRHV